MIVLLLIPLLCASCQDSSHETSGEYIRRLDGQVRYTPPPPEKQPLPSYPWDHTL